jgi:nucleoside-diphosphate-sugar epimerase
VPKMQLSVARLRALGWQPRHGSEESVHMAAKAALAEHRKGKRS